MRERVRMNNKQNGLRIKTMINRYREKKTQKKESKMVEKVVMQ